ncbi:MAG: serine/threonine protein kinase [Deltaproteobacteria bacterium]|nr:serine/threonine protein kinase [Deltaproteobacteria bacterium]
MPGIPPGDSGDSIGNEEPTDVNRMAVPWNPRSGDGLDTIGSESGASPLGAAWLESGTYELAPGAALGEYRIEGKIGQGGMGVVFGAIHPTIGKRAAIKVLKKELCRDPLQLERFVSEARVVNEINHPNIVDIFAFSEMPDGRWYFVMEWLKGETLYQRIHRAPFSFADLVGIVRPVCRALEAAHGKGITHRDLKPENIFLVEVPNERQPHVKLLDFGLAKLQRSYERNHNTAVGTIIGTPQYMAPEQAAGTDIDHRVDVYALGGILFELMTGRPPFQADNAIELVAKHVIEAPIRPSSLQPEIPTVVDELVLKMLAKSPDDRPALSEVIRILERVRWRPGSSMKMTAVRQIPAATPPSDSMSEEEPTSQVDEDFSQMMMPMSTSLPSPSEQLVPTLSEQLAMPVAARKRAATPPGAGDSLEHKITLDAHGVGRPPAESDSMELGPSGGPRPTLVGTAVPLPVATTASGPIRAAGAAKPATPWLVGAAARRRPGARAGAAPDAAPARADRAADEQPADGRRDQRGDRRGARRVRRRARRRR